MILLLKSLKFFLFIGLFSMHITLLEEYMEKSQEFRGVWVSPWGGDQDLVTFNSKEGFIQNMKYILDTVKYYNMNTIIYHVRTHNDALYESKLNPVSPYFSKVDFKEFNPLKWMINESHKRGIEFHAWMNPYRIKTGNKASKEEIISKYQEYANPANDSRCILNGTDSIILDPGREKVRNFIVETINEFLEQFNVDAIHFDDYFYINMGAGGAVTGEFTILDEPDQITYEEYIDNHPETKYKKDSAEDKADWRREQINLLISLIKKNINLYNKNNNKKVQFGISPTGIYKSGDGNVTYDKNGNAITTGSDTKGSQEHYSSYLFCDSLKWINEGWIDYILPQSYWAIDHPIAGYIKVMSWWDKVIKYKRVNLFSGIGLYMADSDYNTYGWKTNENELYEHLVYSGKSENIDGVSIYNFNTLRKYKDGQSTFSSKQVENGIKAWINLVPPTEIKSFEKIVLERPKNFKIENKTLSFNKVNGAKFYVVYRNIDEIRFNSEEIIEIFGDENEKVIWNEKEEGNYTYGIRALSYTNTLGKGVTEKSLNSSKYLSFGITLLLSILVILLF